MTETKTCRFCSPLLCEPDYHDAAVRVHARLPFWYWADELEANRERAKAKHLAHRGKANYQLNMAEMKPVAKRKELSPEQREKEARKARERRAAAKAVTKEKL